MREVAAQRGSAEKAVRQGVPAHVRVGTSAQEWGIGRQAAPLKVAGGADGRCGARLARVCVPRCRRGRGCFKVLPCQHGRTAVSSSGGRYHLHTFHLRFFLSL